GSADFVPAHRRHVRWSSDYGYYLQLIAGFGWSSLPWLRCLPQPTLVMAGTDDPLVPVSNARILASLIPDARLVTIDDGHLFLVTNAGRSAELVSDFLTQDPARSGGTVTMVTYKAPLRDMCFVLYELHRGDALAQLPGFEEMTPDLIDPVLEEAAKLCEEVLFPLNRSGDEEGCLFENGVVRTPRGFQEAYRTFREGGWTSIACDPTYGGQGLAHSGATLIDEMISSSILSFGLYPGLSYGAYVALHSYGSDALKDMYLPKLVEGVWSGTMCLTEAHCGTDL